MTKPKSKLLILTITEEAKITPDWKAYREANQHFEAYKRIKETIAEKFKNSYFRQAFDEMRTPTGLLVATYKTHDQDEFDKATFKANHPALYEQYTGTKTIRRLLIK